MGGVAVKRVRAGEKAARWPKGKFPRRTLLAGASAAALARPLRLAAAQPVTFGLTPVFLDSDIQLLANLKSYLERRLDQPVSLVKRRTYQEITALLLSEEMDAAWICGFPLVQHADALTLVAVPVYRGEPLYQSYVIVGVDDPAASFEDLRGRSHAFSDPDSNSGFLVTRHLLTTMGETPDRFFARTFFTYGHRNVIRAVAAGLADSGSVDGYVWDVVNEIEPSLTARTRVLRRSERLGFPPIACHQRRRGDPSVESLAQALYRMAGDEEGRSLLQTLRLDGFIPGSMALFDGIARKYRDVLRQA
jgi:phosphonate transport system substrate-binding protein